MISLYLEVLLEHKRRRLSLDLKRRVPYSVPSYTDRSSLSRFLSNTTETAGLTTSPVTSPRGYVAFKIRLKNKLTSAPKILDTKRQSSALCYL